MYFSTAFDSHTRDCIIPLILCLRSTILLDLSSQMIATLQKSSLFDLKCHDILLYFTKFLSIQNMGLFMGNSPVFFCCDSTFRVYLTGRLYHSFFCSKYFTNFTFFVYINNLCQQTCLLHHRSLVDRLLKMPVSLIVLSSRHMKAQSILLQ